MGLEAVSLGVVLLAIAGCGLDFFGPTPPQTGRPAPSPGTPVAENDAPPPFDDGMEKAPLPEKSNVSELFLEHLFAESKRIVIRKSEVNDKILYESNKKQDLALLREVLAIVPPGGAAKPCHCIGSPVIEFYYRKKYVGWIALHDGGTIRTSSWNTDAKLVDPHRFFKWFERRGMAGPRRRIESEGATAPTP